MTKAVLTVVLIALPDSVNPSLILGALYQAASPPRARRAAAFTAAAFAVTLAGGALVAFGLADWVLALLPKPSRTLKYSAVIVIGCASVVGGAVIWARRGALSRRPASAAEAAVRRGGSSIAMGAGIAAVELVTAFPYFAAIAVITGSSASTGGKVALLVLYNVVYALPLIGIVVVCLVTGPRADQILARIRSWALRRWPYVAAPLAVAAGTGLAVYGVIRIA